MRFNKRDERASKKGFLFPKEEREGGKKGGKAWKKEARRKKGREGRREEGRSLSSPGHLYLGGVLAPPCYQGKSKAER